LRRHPGVVEGTARIVNDPTDPAICTAAKMMSTKTTQSTLRGPLVRWGTGRLRVAAAYRAAGKCGGAQSPVL